jgi:hypothetical protein
VKPSGPGNGGRQLQEWVKTGKAHSEHMTSALPPKADVTVQKLLTHSARVDEIHTQIGSDVARTRPYGKPIQLCMNVKGLLQGFLDVERLMRLANGPLPWSWIDPDKALPWVEERIGLALAESQVAAIRLALMSKVLVMTGGPGVGKTTIVKAILRIADYIDATSNFAPLLTIIDKILWNLVRLRPKHKVHRVLKERSIGAHRGSPHVVGPA